MRTGSRDGKIFRSQSHIISKYIANINMVNCNSTLFILSVILIWFGEEIVCFENRMSRSDFEHGNKYVSRIAFGSCMK